MKLRSGTRDGGFYGLLGSTKAYLTNLTPSDFPRRQITSHLRPVLASRENASRNLPANALESSIVSFAPVEDISRTTHRRAAKPPSRVIHPGWYSDLRGSRFFLRAIASLPAENIPGTSLPCGGFINRCYSRADGWAGHPSVPAKLASARLARPRKGHYTFARRNPDHIHRGRGFHGDNHKALI
jgi:hypothetical protein